MEVPFVPCRCRELSVGGLDVAESHAHMELGTSFLAWGGGCIPIEPVWKTLDAVLATGWVVMGVSSTDQLQLEQQLMFLV